VRLAIPVVEVAHHKYLFGVGRPYSEIDALLPVDVGYVGPQLLVQPEMVALLKEVCVLIGNQAKIKFHRRIAHLPPLQNPSFPYCGGKA